MSTHTPGPWRWEINAHSKTVSLSGGRPTFDKMVLTFRRWGMQGAQPVFWDWDSSRNGGRDMLACELAIPYAGREHHSHWFAVIDHPDANLIAAAPDLLDALKEIVEYSGGADSALDDEYVMERVYAAINKAEGSE